MLTSTGVSPTCGQGCLQHATQCSSDESSSHVRAFCKAAIQTVAISWYSSPRAKQEHCSRPPCRSAYRAVSLAVTQHCNISMWTSSIVLEQANILQDIRMQQWHRLLSSLERLFSTRHLQRSSGTTTGCDTGAGTLLRLCTSGSSLTSKTLRLQYLVRCGTCSSWHEP